VLSLVVFRLIWRFSGTLKSEVQSSDNTLFYHNNKNLSTVSDITSKNIYKIWGFIAKINRYINLILDKKLLFIVKLLKPLDKRFFICYTKTSNIKIYFTAVSKFGRLVVRGDYQTVKIGLCACQAN
jgi:hypothetical protein